MRDFGIRRVRSLPYAYPAPSLAIDTYSTSTTRWLRFNIFTAPSTETVEYRKRRVTIQKRSANTTQCALVSSTPILGTDLRGFCASDAHAGQNCASEPSGGRRIRLQGLRSPTLRLKFARQWPHWLQFHQPPEPQCSIKLCTSSLLISLNTSSYKSASSSFVH